MRIFLFLGSLLIIGFSVWVLLSDDSSEGLAGIKRKDQTWVRHPRLSIWEELTAKTWRSLTTVCDSVVWKGRMVLAVALVRVAVDGRIPLRASLVHRGKTGDT